MKSVAVFCGASSSNDKTFTEKAYALGQFLAQNEIALVYGGAKVGLMGAVADGALSAGGKVTGVLPGFLSGKEIAHEGLTELITVETMHERKMRMYELSEGFIVLPGGFGTFEEVFEILTWQQLGLHGWPVGFLNVDGYYDHLSAQFEHMKSKELLTESHRDMAIFDDNQESLIQKMNDYEAPEAPKWIKPSTT